MTLQQHLPLAVLKRMLIHLVNFQTLAVATTPTARGIETARIKANSETYIELQQHLPLAVLKLV